MIADERVYQCDRCSQRRRLSLSAARIYDGDRLPWGWAWAQVGTAVRRLLCTECARQSRNVVYAPPAREPWDPDDEDDAP